jgi:indole-3-glycerol phosphate synthase
VIAELKLASPSGFRASVDPSEYLRAVSGAAALSVVTEPVAFGGSYYLLRLAAESTDLPILMKYFVSRRSSSARQSPSAPTPSS